VEHGFAPERRTVGFLCRARSADRGPRPRRLRCLKMPSRQIIDAARIRALKSEAMAGHGRTPENDIPGRHRRRCLSASCRSRRRSVDCSTAMGHGNSKAPGEHALAAALTWQSGTTAFPRLPRNWTRRGPARLDANDPEAKVAPYCQRSQG